MKSIVLFLCISIFIFGCNQKQVYEHNSENFDLIKLNDGVYACIHKFGGKAICNVGIIDNGAETLIFDTFLSPKVAAELLSVVEQLELSPIKYVVNSHSHNDHIRGNQLFAKDVQIISTKITADLIKEWEPQDIKEEKEWAPKRFNYYDSLQNAFQGDKDARDYKVIQMWRPYYEVLSNSYQEVITRLPNVFVDNELIIEGPDRNIHLISKGAGHTDSDLILYLPEDKIVFTGDLVFNDMHPYMPHGNPEGWKNWVDFMEGLNIELVVPGHGEIGVKTEISEMRSYINVIEELASKMIIENITTEEAVNIKIPPQYEDYWFDRFFVSNLKFMHSRLMENQ